MKNLTQITPEQHGDFIWTWKSNARGAKVSLWLPYFSEVTKVPSTKLWHISYNGGNIAIDLNEVDFIMFYGASGNLPLDFLDALSQHKISLIVHRRNQIYPLVFHPANIGDSKDVLTKQIRIREHQQKRTYIAKVLIKQRLLKFQDNINIPGAVFKELSAAKTIAEVRQIEAITTSKYWEAWFDKLEVEEIRRQDGPIASALDAGSKFIYGIILRWILFHKLSPCHGFLHEPTGYPALVYDLMEPYRYIIEKSVVSAFESVGERDSKKLIARTFDEIKKYLEEVVYVPATRQYVRRKNLLHGIVLALRAYLLDESLRFVIPVEGMKNGGRPIKIGYRLPGETKAKKGGT